MKHLLKFYRKGTAFLMAFCLMALLFSFSCAAAENTTTYRFSDINLEVQVPSELIGFTRSVTSNNAYLDLIGTDDVEELRSLMVVNHVYLEAVPQDVRYELIISGKEAGSASTDFTELSDTDLDSLFNEYLQKSDAIDNESVTENITASAIEHVNGIPYFVTSVKSVANNQVTVYMKKYYTVMQGNAVSFFIQSNGEEIDSATAQLLTEVVTSAQYKTIHKSILENAFFTELALIVYLVEKSKKKTKKQIEADEKRLRAEYAKQEAEAAKKVQEASGETEVSETGISENETSGGQNGNNYQ